MSPPERPSALAKGPLSPFDMVCASYLYEAMTGYAGSLDRLRTLIDDEHDLDLSTEAHRLALLKFLNDWGCCRNLATDWHWLASARLECWYCAAQERLASFSGPPWALDAKGRRDLVEVFNELSTFTAARKLSKGKEVLVSYGPTAAAKTLFILRPGLFPAWDGPIRKKLGYAGDGESYAQFAEDVQGKIDESARHYKQLGFVLESLPEKLGRPAYTTLAQLVIEYYWITLTRGVTLRGREEVADWVSWPTPSPADARGISGLLVAGRRYSGVGEPQESALVKVPSSGRIGLVGCVKMKRSHAAPAADLYVSPLFRGRRSYVERACRPWFILSALHGLVRPDALIEPYDVALSDASRGQRRAWAAKVLLQLDAELGSCSGLAFEIHAGANYTDFGLVAGLQERGATVEQPAAGLNLGRQLAFYADAGRAEESRAESAGVTPLQRDDEVAAGMPSLVPRCRDDDVLAAIADLDEATPIAAREWPAGVTCLDQPGLYSWVVDLTGAADLSRGLGHDLTPGRIYAGQAGATKWPSGKSGGNTLGKRVGRMHLGGRVRMSTFRWTLASVLFDQLDVQVQASMVITASSEEALTEWMLAHLSVTVHAHDDRDTLEDLEHRVLDWLDPPFNLRHMQPTRVRHRLTELRRRISRETIPSSVYALHADSTQTARTPTGGEMAIFDLTLQQTYYKMGFFNVVVGYDRYVRKTEGPVRLRLGRDGAEIEARIDRHANQNGTARVMGGVQLKRWFQGNFKPMDTVAVDLSSQDVIVLNRK